MMMVTSSLGLRKWRRFVEFGGPLKVEAYIF